MKSIALFNPRGGVGKTTFTINLSAALGCLGVKVLLIDFDPESHATHFIGKNLPRNFKSLYHFMNGDTDIEVITYKHKYFDYVPSEMLLADYNASYDEYVKQVELVSNTIKKIKKYDLIILDSPSSIGIINGIITHIADFIISPITIDAFTMKSIMNLLHILSWVSPRHNINHKLVINKYIANRNNDDFVKTITDKYGNIMFSNIISENTDLAVSLKYNKTVYEYNLHGVGANEFRKFSHEVLSTIA